MVFQILFSGVVFYFINKIFSLKNLFNPLVFIIIFHFIFFYVGLFYKDMYNHIKIESFTIFLINYSFISIHVLSIFNWVLFFKCNNHLIEWYRDSKYLLKILIIIFKRVSLQYRTIVSYRGIVLWKPASSV